MSLLTSFFGFSDKAYYRDLFRLSLPLVLAQVMGSSLTFIDNVMIGSLGDEALAGLNHANQVSFLLLVCMYGVTSATTAFTAQFWGKGDKPALRQTLGMAVIMGQLISWLFFLASFFFGRPILSLFTPEQAVLQNSCDYLSILCFMFPVIGLGHSYAAVLKGSENVKLPTFCSITGLVTNALLNYLLIFGKLGMPALGVKGAALATVLAQVLDTSLLLILSHRMEMPTAWREYPMFPVSRDFIRRFSAIAVPIFLNESLWALAQVTLVWMYARLGTAMSAAASIHNVINRLSYMFIMGMANAACVHIGKTIGMGHVDDAHIYARRYLRIGPSLAALIGVLLWFAGPYILLFYNISSDSVLIVHNAIRIFAVQLPIGTYSYLMIVGVLRGGGDSRYSLLIDGGTQWILAVGCVAMGVFVLHVPPHWIYAMIIPNEIAKFLLGHLRFRSRKWIHNLTG